MAWALCKGQVAQTLRMQRGIAQGPRDSLCGFLTAGLQRLHGSEIRAYCKGHHPSEQGML